MNNNINKLNKADLSCCNELSVETVGTGYRVHQKILLLIVILVSEFRAFI
jgi:hypothetical protein